MTIATLPNPIQSKMLDFLTPTSLARACVTKGLNKLIQNYCDENSARIAQMLLANPPRIYPVSGHMDLEMAKSGRLRFYRPSDEEESYAEKRWWHITPSLWTEYIRQREIGRAWTKVGTNWLCRDLRVHHQIIILSSEIPYSWNPVSILQKEMKQHKFNDKPPNFPFHHPVHKYRIMNCQALDSHKFITDIVYNSSFPPLRIVAIWDRFKLVNFRIFEIGTVDGVKRQSNDSQFSCYDFNSHFSQNKLFFQVSLLQWKIFDCQTGQVKKLDRIKEVFVSSNRYFCIDDTGKLNAYDTKTEKQIWSKDYHANPTERYQYKASDQLICELIKDSKEKITIRTWNAHDGEILFSQELGSALHPRAFVFDQIFAYCTQSRAGAYHMSLRDRLVLYFKDVTTKQKALKKSDFDLNLPLDETVVSVVPLRNRLCIVSQVVYRQFSKYQCREYRVDDPIISTQTPQTPSRNIFSRISNALYNIVSKILSFILSKIRRPFN